MAKKREQILFKSRLNTVFNKAAQLDSLTGSQTVVIMRMKDKTFTINRPHMQDILKQALAADKPWTRTSVDDLLKVCPLSFTTLQKNWHDNIIAHT